MKHWSFSLLLAAVYLATFSFWHFSNPSWTAAGGLVSTALLLVAFIAAARERYFCNRIDAFLHAVVILDVLLEGLFVTTHHSQSPYLCALEFAVVVGGYRLFCLRRLRPALRHSGGHPCLP